MPIITVQFIQGTATTETKRELVKKMTDTFVSVYGEVSRPFVYCLIQETPALEWGIAGQPMPDLPWLSGAEYEGYHQASNEIMRQVIAQQPPPSEQG